MRRIPRVSASLLVPSWLTRQELLLALIAVGLGVGVLGLFRPGLRLARTNWRPGIDGAELLLVADSPVRETPPLKLRPE